MRRYARTCGGAIRGTTGRRIRWRQSPCGGCGRASQSSDLIRYTLAMPIQYYAKAIHILFIISWMAGIFYLPRIFVHYVEGKSAGEDVRRLKTMARTLYHFASAMAV